MVNKKLKLFFLIILGGLLFIPLSSSIVKIKVPEIPIIPGNLSWNQSLGDGSYWRLDGTNSPPTADWYMNSKKFNFSTGGGLTSNTGQAKIDFSAGGLNYFAPLDGHYFYDSITIDDHATFSTGVVISNAVGTLGKTELLDISDYTNLGVTSPIKLTGDTLSIDPNGNMSVYNITASGIICDSSGCGIGGGGGNPFDQSLNTTDNVTFDYVNVTSNLNVKGNISANYGFFDYLGSLANKIGNLFVSNATIEVLNVTGKTTFNDEINHRGIWNETWYNNSGGVVLVKGWNGTMFYEYYYG